MLAHRSLKRPTFSRLYNLIRTKRLIEVALDNVLENEGAKTAGVDGMTRRDLATEKARMELVEKLHKELCAKTYRPCAVRRVYIPKENGDKRPLGIPTIRDRVVQEMLQLILEPIFESQFYAHSYGFRPFRSTHHAALRLKDMIGRHGFNTTIEGDIRKCFDRVHHLKLLQILRRTITDERIIQMIHAMLKAGYMEDGLWQITEEGTPQGGIISPLLANIYLNELDQFIAAKWENLSKVEKNKRIRQQTDFRCYIVRYADDFVVLIKGTMAQAETLKADIGAFLNTELGLELSTDKTVITDVKQGFDFLGFHIRQYQQATLITPSQKAIRKFRQKVKQKAWEGFSVDNDAGAIEHLNRFLIGWAMYYRRVSSARAFRVADHYVWHRVWKTTHRLRNPRSTRRDHYKSHYIPYRFDIRTANRKHGGLNYGAWANSARTTAFIIVRLAFIPIRYVNFYPQLHPYIPEQRATLEKRVGQLELPPDLLPGVAFNPEYGEEWNTLRRTVLRNAGHRCYRCQKRINGRTAHVHHRERRKSYKIRRQANLLENLIALCPVCHSWAEGKSANEALPL